MTYHDFIKTIYDGRMDGMDGKLFSFICTLLLLLLLLLLHLLLMGVVQTADFRTLLQYHLTTTSLDIVYTYEAHTLNPATRSSCNFRPLKSHYFAWKV
jgi:hypothetical protein